MAGEKTHDVQILKSADALNAAVAQGAIHAGQLAATLGPDPVDSLGKTPVRFETLLRFEQERLRVIPILQQAAIGGGTRAAAANLALIWFGHLEHLDRLRELIAAAAPAERPELLQFFSGSGEVVRETPGAEVLGPAIRDFIPARDDPGRLTAIKAVFELGGTVDEDGVVGELIEAREKNKFDSWIPRALGLLARSGGPSSLPAAQALLRSSFADSLNVRRAGLSRDARLVPELEQLLNAEIKNEVRGGVLQALARVQGVAAVPRLLDALIDPELRHAAATGLGIAAAGSADESIVAALTMAAAGDRATFYVPAMTLVGGALAMRTLAGLTRRANVTTAIAAAWRAQNITGAMAIQRFVDCGVIHGMPTAAELTAATESEHAWQPPDVWLFFHFLRRRGTFYEGLGRDRDDNEVARHPLLIAACAGATRGRMAIEHISQDARALGNPEEWELTVRFVWGDRVYQLKTQTFGVHFDLDGTRALLNEALRDRGYPERFLRLGTHDTEMYLFGDQRAVEAACDDLLILHRSTRDSSFEWRDKVTAMLRAAGSV
jgi:hypothetical protein